MSINPQDVTYAGALMLAGAHAVTGDMSEDFRASAHKLMPPGRAFPRDPGTSNDEMMAAIAFEQAVANALFWQVERERDPRTTTYLIGEWERALGLPECGSASENLDDRRGAAHAKYAGASVVSLQDFVDFASRMGYTVTITEHGGDVFKCGVGKMGDPLGSGNRAFSWTVSGSTGSNDALLSCLLQKLKPANTFLTVALT